MRPWNALLDARRDVGLGVPDRDRVCDEYGDAQQDHDDDERNDELADCAQVRSPPVAWRSRSGGVRRG